MNKTEEYWITMRHNVIRAQTEEAFEINIVFQTFLAPTRRHYDNPSSIINQPNKYKYLNSTLKKNIIYSQVRSKFLLLDKERRTVNVI